MTNDALTLDDIAYRVAKHGRITRDEPQPDEISQIKTAIRVAVREDAKPRIRDPHAPLRRKKLTVNYDQREYTVHYDIYEIASYLTKITQRVGHRSTPHGVDKKVWPRYDDNKRVNFLLEYLGIADRGRIVEDGTLYGSIREHVAKARAALQRAEGERS